ncbi:sensor histidine kinase [Luteolibacter arcticus]|uniref:sensor histidine kinase n=1 Tax=Luteolibacter arcticus TaxID=1581411 RepID=UPI002221C548|nr:HAMP domain-containing sensor histidine kinase [Luteolibacter arcticus]
MPPWVWTLLVCSTLAVLVAVAGTLLSRQTERISERPPGNRVDDAFRETARRIDDLEVLWEKALDDEAARLLKDGLSLPPDDTVIAGITQRSLLNAGFSDPGRQHLPVDGSTSRWLPVLAHYAREQPGEWVLAESDVLQGSGWITMPGKPLAWWRGNGRLAAVLVLDPLAAAKVVEQDLALRMPDFSGEPGSFSWAGPSGNAWLGDAPDQAKSDEIVRHVSRFGDWTLYRHYPLRVVTRYRVPVLAGSFAVAALLLGGGIAIVSWQRKAIRLAEERVSFVNRVSHELRTPLTNLLLNTDLALDGLPVEDGKVRRRLGLIREETSRLSRIVDNVLAFARIERGTSEAHAVSCSATEVLGEVRESFAPLFERKSIVCDYHEDVQGDVMLDRDALSQILSNLLSNVEKYAGEGAKASVRLSIEGSQLVAEVEDDGPGVPANSRKRIFLPFERAGSRIDEGASGTGLGLAISRDLAERMGGQLELMPSAGGSKFRLAVPLMERNRA